MTISATGFLRDWGRTMPWNIENTRETSKFLSRIGYLSDDQRNDILLESKRILSLGSDSADDRSEKSILVVGEVQSGKTLSFTTGVQLARENGYKLTVVIAGTKRNLRDQTYSRLMEDLTRGQEGAPQTWSFYKTAGSKDLSSILSSLRSWDDPKIPSQYRVSPILTVMKTAASMYKLEVLIRQLERSYGRVIPTLFVDDEADQAGLNIANDKADDKSAVYRALTRLRNSSPVHTYLMYTATSQALMLVDLADHMSPDHVVSLKTSSSYVGAIELFNADSTDYFRQIPETELDLATKPQDIYSSVSTFNLALSYFFLSVAVAQRRGSPKPISMLVHPDRTKLSHELYSGQIETWIKEVEVAFSNDNYSEVNFEKYFGKALQDLSQTCNLLDSFDVASRQDLLEVLRMELPFWINQTQRRIVNSSKLSRNIDKEEWSRHPSWILIGADKVERGYTIENLAVTYMPRGIGMGISDTIQQRGRFMGHKRIYKDLLRGWFSLDLVNAFRNIAEMEILLKAELKRVEDENLSLKLWKRQLIIATNLRPTRDAVIALAGLNYTALRGGFRFMQTRLLDPLVADSHTWAFAMKRLSSLREQSIVLSKDTRESGHRHKYAFMPIQKVTSFLESWPLSERDAQDLSGLLLGIQHYADLNPQLNAVVVFMDDLRERKRSVSDESLANSAGIAKYITIEQPLQGPSANYLGDREMIFSDALTIQVHNIVPKVGATVGNPVLALAISWPDEFSNVIIHQTE